MEREISPAVSLGLRREGAQRTQDESLAAPPGAEQREQNGRGDDDVGDVDLVIDVGENLRAIDADHQMGIVAQPRGREDAGRAVEVRRREGGGPQRTRSFRTAASA